MMDQLTEIIEEQGPYWSGIPVLDGESLGQMLFRFVLNTVVAGIIISCFYYPKCKRRDY